MPNAVKVKVDWDAARADPVEFCKVFLKRPNGSPFIPHEGQATIMHGIRRTTVTVTGRQFGKSEGLAAYAAWFGVTHSHRNVWIFAPTLEQAKIIFNLLVGYFRQRPLSDMVLGKPKNVPFPHLELKNGTTYEARGLNSPNNGRGQHAHLGIVDEAAFVKEGVLREVVEPMFNVSGQEPDSALVLTSTPFGEGEFYDFWNDCGRKVDAGNTRYARFHYTCFDNPYADMEHLEEVKERYGEDSPIWLAEYLGVFQDDETSVFSSSDIKAAYEMWPEGLRFPCAPVEGHRYIQGLDLANRSDYFVSSMFDTTDRHRAMMVNMDRYRRKGYPFYKQRARALYNAYNRARTIGDATSLGESVTQDLSDISVLGYEISTNDAKWQIVQELNRMLQERRLVIPFHKDIIAELGYFRYHITPAKVLRMEAPRGKHDDIVMSMALAAHLACSPVVIGKVRSISAVPTIAKREKTDPNAAWLEYMQEPA